MDQIKLLVKDVLHKIQDIPDVPFSHIRMSEIASESSLSTETSRSVSEHSISDDTNTINADGHHIIEAEQLKEDKTEAVKNQKNRTVLPNPDGLNKESTILKDLKPLQVDDKGSHDSVCSLPPLLPKAGKIPKPKIRMGKRALTGTKDGDSHENPSVIVHELVNVNEKFQDKITHYIGRMYHRRLSRESKNNDDDDDGTNSNYSAGSFSTFGTPDSLYNGKSYFSLIYPQRSECEFDFLKSTDDLNKDTTVGTMDSTLDSVDTKDVSTDLDYDPQKFLKNALGDVSFESLSLNTSFPKSRLYNSQSIDTVNAPTLLSRAGSLYSSVRKSIKRACSFKERTADEVSVRNRYKEKDRCQSFSPDRFEPAENLMQELYVQNGIIFQVSKALTYCKNTKDITSPEYIEAEKILLVASCQKEAIQAALDAVEFGEKETFERYSGTLQISDIIYFLKGDNFTESDTPKNYTEYFVVVVTSGKTVVASKVLAIDKNGEIKVNKTFTLSGLTTGFEISVAIYSMKVKHVEKNYGSLLKPHKKDRKAPCPSPKSFFHLNHRSSSKNLLVENVLSIKPSSFTLWGTCTITCSDMERTHFRMHHVPLCSSLESYFTAVLSSDVNLTNRFNGFLTIGIEDKAHLLWNRRWCTLDGSVLRYWNYPSEEFTSNPIGCIDLRHASEKASPADRSICPRPKTLCLLIKNQGSFLKYFLSADSHEEKLTWLEEINFVIGTLGAWNCLNSNT